LALLADLGDLQKFAVLTTTAAHCETSSAETEEHHCPRGGFRNSRDATMASSSHSMPRRSVPSVLD
jgi:hypothetical protein